MRSRIIPEHGSIRRLCVSCSLYRFTDLRSSLQQALGYCEVLCEQGPAVAPRSYQVWKTLPACERDKSDAAVRDKFRHLRTGVPQGQPLPEVLYLRRMMTA